MVKAAAPVYPSTLPTSLSPLFAMVQIWVGVDGKVARAKVWKTSGYAAADDAAIKAAQATVYAPKMVDCNPTMGVYLFKAEVRSSEH